MPDKPIQKVKKEKKAWVVTADMGLGHQRAAYPLTDLADDGIITVGASTVSDGDEAKLWKKTRGLYEFASRLSKLPIIGKPIFSIIDALQKIQPYYPRRDLSKPNYPVKLINNLVKKGLGKDLIDTCKTKKTNPFITTFYTPNASAVHYEYPGKIYTVICDADIARGWVPDSVPQKTKVTFLVPCKWVVNRLRAYGVPAKNIIQTGFPMPKEIIGKNMEILKGDMGRRLYQLDPDNKFWPKNQKSIEGFLGKKNCEKPAKLEPLTITFAVGGAGAQKEIGIGMVKSLQKLIKAGEIKVNLVAGVRKEVYDYFENSLRSMRLVTLLGNEIKIIYHEEKTEYFKLFAQAMRTTGLLWTKPSELSFYTGLGIPMCIAPPIGSQEDFNNRWLLELHAGFPQGKTEYTDQWLMDLLHEGRLAEVAWSAFLNVQKMGTYKIEELIQTGKIEESDNPIFK